MALTDQQIWDQGLKFISPQKYHLNPFVFPGQGTQDQTTTPGTGVGIPYTGAFTNFGGGGGGGAGNISLDPKIRTPRNYRRDSTDVSWNKNFSTPGLPGHVPQSGPGRQFIYDNTGKPYDDIHLYGGTGEDDEQNWWTRSRNAITGGIMGMISPPLAALRQGAQWLENKLPVNERAIMENQMLGSGFAIDNSGKIVRMGGEYDTAGNIFSDYNAAQMDEDTFDDRIKSLGNMSVEGRRKRIAAILAAKKQWQEAQGVTDTIVDRKKIEKDMAAYKKAGGPETTFFDETITAAPTHINAGPLHGTGDKGQHSTQGRSTVGGPSGGEGQWKGEDGGRVPFFYGGLVGLL